MKSSSYPPPIQFVNNTHSCRFNPKIKSVLYCIILATASLNANADIIYNGDYSYDQNNILHLSGGTQDDRFSLLTISNNSSLEINGLIIDTNPWIMWNQYSVQISEYSSLTINGDTRGKFTTTKWDGSTDDVGTYALYAGGTKEKGHSKIFFNGNVDLLLTHNVAENPTDVGANMLYARYGSEIEIGSRDGESSTRLWVLAVQPDLISAKNGSSVIFNSKHNQLIGSIDMMDDRAKEGIGNDAGNTVSVVLSGADSFWFGDEKTWMNSDSPIESGDIFNITLENGAQWTYFANEYTREVDSKTYYAIPKRISSITLKGGIINLFDENIKETWQQIGLWDALKNPNYGIDPETKHDYLRIGYLNGNGGIFRMDLNAEDKTQSDMLYIEDGTGTHYFEPYNLELLESITPENTLTFALVKKDAGVKFVDKVNLEGETLYQYELEIDSKVISAEDLSNSENAYWNKSETTNQSDPHYFELSDFNEGTNWFIKRITISESTAARAMTGAGYAAYDAAIEMDRRDRRLTESLRNEQDGANGLWVRAIKGRSGIDNQYRWDRAGVVIGYDHQLGESNTLGAWFSYTNGDADLLDVNGTGDLTRYELALYDTFEFDGTQYLDFVGRIGRVSTEFDAASSAYQTSGDFDQDYAAISAEYGILFAHEASGLFVEPQAQVQAAFLKSYDYDSERGMKVKAESETSVLGRLGFRAGKTLDSAFANGQVYVRADVLHQFTDGQDSKFSDDAGHVIKTEWGDNGTWGLFGLGAAVVWNKNYGLQFDVERAFGGDIENTWLITGRFNYRF